MRSCGNNGFYADKGKMFVLTTKGKEEVASYRNLDVGKPLDFGYADEHYAYYGDVTEGYVEEVEDPNWVVLPGFRVVYDYKGNQIGCGNPHVFHDREMAERYMDSYTELYKRYGWNDHNPYIIEDIYEGKKPVPNKEYKGKRVFVSDNWFGDVGVEGDLVDDEIADWFLNCVPPRTMRNGMIQCGEPTESCIEGATYATFVKIDDDVWEYKGDCLGGTTEHGTPIPIVG